MATTKAEFVTVASELFTEFTEAVKTLALSTIPVYDPDTNTETSAVTVSVDALREEYSQIEKQQIGQQYFKLLVINSGDFPAVFTVTDYSATFDGESVSIDDGTLDPLGAVWTLKCRLS